VTDVDPVNWLRLQIFPDGGIARLRVHGIPTREWSASEKSKEIELSALKYGGRIIAYNDAHYGNVSSLLSEGRGRNMGDGWETRRRREPGNDWCVIALAQPGRIRKIEVDTAHFKGNFADRVSIQAARVVGGTDSSLKTQAMFWQTLLPEQKLQMDLQHYYEAEIADLGPVTHVRFNMFPDGGVSRLRLWGVLE
jgi:allantoicase